VELSPGGRVRNHDDTKGTTTDELDWFFVSFVPLWLKLPAPVLPSRCDSFQGRFGIFCFQPAVSSLSLLNRRLMAGIPCRDALQAVLVQSGELKRMGIIRDGHVAHWYVAGMPRRMAVLRYVERNPSRRFDSLS
jgi:hypothetical protein